MDDIGGVGFIEGRRYLTKASNSESGVKTALFLEDIAEFFAMEELHDHKRHLSVLIDARIGDLNNILAPDLGGDAGLAAEAFAQLFAFEEVGVHYFERVVALGFEMGGFIDGAHSAFCDASNDAVAASKQGSRREGCGH